MSSSSNNSQAAAGKMQRIAGAAKQRFLKLAKSRAVLPVMILGAAAVICVALLLNRPTIEAEPIEPPVTSIRTTTANSQSLTLTVSSRGKVQPAMVSDVSAAVNGPVAWISPALVPGGYFKEGDELLRIDASDYQTALEKAQAAKMQAEAEANHAARELERIRNLANQNVASDSQLQDARRVAEVAGGRLQNAEADLHQARLNLQRTTLKAPFNAIVETRNIELGQNVSPGQSVATLYGADTVEVKLPLANRQLGFLTVPLGHRGALPADQAPDVALTGVYAGERHTWQGKLVRTEAGLDASNNTVQAIVRVEQPKAPPGTEDEGLSAAIPLPIGLLVEAEISGKTIDDVIALPRHVIRKNTQVLVAAPDNTLRIREVDILRLESDRVLIEGGLRDGEQVCISPIQAVIDGMKIRVVDDEVSSR